MKKNIKWVLILILEIVVAIILGLIIVKTKNIKNLEMIEKTDNIDDVISVNEFCIKDNCLIFKEGDHLEANLWNGLVVKYNGESYNSFPVFKNGITKGSKAKEVIEKFEIKKGYAIINMEVPTKEEDGTTDVIEEEYINNDFLNREYLDADIIFGYKKEGDNWKMLEYSELTKYFEEEKANDYILLYKIDINGMMFEKVGVGKVISVNVIYNNKITE